MDKAIITVGWREWVLLPKLGIPYIKAKVDTGARSSAIHAFGVKPFRKRGIQHVRFSVHPLQERSDIVINCECPVVDHRWVSDSGGHKERRWVIVTSLRIGGDEWDVEMTLTNRDNMKFRMLIGRTAMHDKLVVNPTKSYCATKKPSKTELNSVYARYQNSGD